MTDTWHAAGVRRSALLATVLAVLGALLLAGPGPVDAPSGAPGAPPERVVVDDLRLLAGGRGPAADLDEVRGELRTALRRARRGADIPARTKPTLGRLRQNKWNGPARCTADPGQTTSDLCPLGDRSSDRTVVLMGDSHLNMWIRGLQGPARRAGIKLVPVIKFGCSPYELRMWRFDLGPWEECFTWREWAHEQVERLDPEAVILSSHRNFTLSRAGETSPMPEAERPQAFYDGVSRTLQMLEPHTDDTYVLADINYLKEDPVRCLKRPRASMRRCESPVTADTRDHNAILRRVVEDTNASAGPLGLPAAPGTEPVTFHDPNDLICLSGRCPIVADTTFMYFDFFHVSRRWAKHVGPVLAPSIGIAP